MHFTYLVAGVGSLVVVFIAQQLIFLWQQHQKARCLGCEPANKYPHRLPWMLDPSGKDLQRKRFAALLGGRYNRFYQDKFAQHGRTIEERSPVGRTICTIEVENFRAVLAVNFDDYDKKAVRTAPILRVIGLGIFTKEGAAWKQSRDLLKPLFMRAELSDVDRFRKHVDRMLSLIPRDGSTIDLKPLLGKMVGSRHLHRTLRITLL